MIGIVSVPNSFSAQVFRGTITPVSIQAGIKRVFKITWQLGGGWWEEVVWRGQSIVSQGHSHTLMHCLLPQYLHFLHLRVTLSLEDQCQRYHYQHSVTSVTASPDIKLVGILMIVLFWWVKTFDDFGSHTLHVRGGMTVEGMEMRTTPTTPFMKWANENRD